MVAVTSGVEDNNESKSLGDSVVIRFAEPDKDNPFDWRPAKKWYVTSTSCSLFRIYFITKDDNFSGGALCVFSVAELFFH
jgi:hypothetical protein